MAKTHSIETTTGQILLENISTIAKNKFVESVCSEDFSCGYGVSVTNKDGQSLLVTKNHILSINTFEAE
jgi:hypothetical protein